MWLGTVPVLLSNYMVRYSRSTGLELFPLRKARRSCFEISSIFIEADTGGQ